MKPYRNKKIGKFIRESDCVCCCITGSINTVNHHIIGNGYSGMGTKAPDWAQIAMTHELHSELHDKGWKAFEKKYGRTQKSMVAETISVVHVFGGIDITEIDMDDWVSDEMEKLTHE